MQIRLYILTGMVCLAAAAHAQQPVAWTYTAKPIGTHLYEIHVTAKIDAGWHIYSGHQPKTAVAVPTSISFTADHLLAFKRTKEEGQVIHYKDKKAGIAQDQYANKVDFIRVVKLKASGKTRISGSITYQACTDHECLPPVSNTFNVEISPAENSK